MLLRARVSVSKDPHHGHLAGGLPVFKVAIRSPGDKPWTRKTEIFEFRTFFGVIRMYAGMPIELAAEVIPSYPAVTARGNTCVDICVAVGDHLRVEALGIASTLVAQSPGQIR